MHIFLFGLSNSNLHVASFLKMPYNGLQLPEGGDFEALHFQPSRNLDRSTELDLTTVPPLLGSCCCAYVLHFLGLSPGLKTICSIGFSTGSKDWKKR